MDHGSIATDGTGNWNFLLTSSHYFNTLRCMVCGESYLVTGGKDTTQGTPSQPSLRMDAKGVWKFRWAVINGTRTITVSVKQAVNASPRPSLLVKANPDIGVNADVEETAPAGTGWVTIGPATITPSSDGAVEVELKNNLDTQFATTPCYFDTETIATA